MSGPATGETRYAVANDDQSGIVREGVSFYPVSSDGLLTRKKEVSTSGFGISGGYFGTDRSRTLNSGSQGCVYSSSGAVVNNPFSISAKWRSFCAIRDGALGREQRLYPLLLQVHPARPSRRVPDLACQSRGPITEESCRIVT